MVRDQLRSFGEMGGGMSLDLVAAAEIMRAYGVPEDRRWFYFEWLKILVAELVLPRTKDGG